MSSLKSVAEQARVPLLTAYQALTAAEGVDAALRDQVRRVAAEQGYSLRITIRDVAALAGVSVSTVSYVINESPLIQAATRRKVETAIRALGYRPNSTARNLKASQSRMIGYAWHRVQDEVQRNPILDRFLYEMAQAVEGEGYHVLTFAQAERHQEQSYTDLIRSSRVDGFVLSDTTYQDPRIERLQALGIPFACFGRATTGWEFAAADDDGQAGLRLVVTHLVSQGHRRIAMIGWPAGTVAGDIRVRGYQEAVLAAGLSADARWLVRTPNDVAHGRQAAAQMLGRQPPPTAIVCASDIIAIGVRMYLEEAGLQAGRDVALASYDDTPVAEALGLTSVHQRIDVIAQAVTARLLGEMRGTPVEPRQLLVAPSLVVRSSSSAGQPISPH